MILAACGADHDDVDRKGTVEVATVRECVRAAGSLPEDPPQAIRGLPRLNALMRRTNRGVVRTPPPDPTFEDFVAAYFLVFNDAQTARRAVVAGREAVLEWQRSPGSVRPDSDYELAEVQRNVLVLYLDDPRRAEGQREAIEACIRDARG